jgi:hypothetical protein
MRKDGRQTNSWRGHRTGLLARCKAARKKVPGAGDASQTEQDIMLLALVILTEEGRW